MKIALLGFGLSGLSLYWQLRDTGHELSLFDKGRGPGGRFATRRRGEGRRFDHGISYMQSDLSAEFQGIDPDLFFRDENGFYVRGGATRLFKSSGADVQLCERAVRLKPDLNSVKPSWTVFFDSGRTEVFQKLAISFPTPQVVELCENSGIDYFDKGAIQKLQKVTYTPALVLMGEFTQLPTDSHSPRVSSWSLSERKGNSSRPHDAVVVFSGEVSRMLYDKEDSFVVSQLLDFINNDFNTELKEPDLKRWRYAFCDNPLSDAFIELATGIYVYGDSYQSDANGLGVERAIQSARSLAQDMIAISD